eukprot:scaffold4131_cov227-Pinguiococcus_pyrenoidosus.AAC.1
MQQVSSEAHPSFRPFRKRRHWQQISITELSASAPTRPNALRRLSSSSLAASPSSSVSIKTGEGSSKRSSGSQSHPIDLERIRGLQNAANGRLRRQASHDPEERGGHVRRRVRSRHRNDAGPLETPRKLLVRVLVLRVADPQRLGHDVPGHLLKRVPPKQPWVVEEGRAEDVKGVVPIIGTSKSHLRAGHDALSPVLLRCHCLRFHFAARLRLRRSLLAPVFHRPLSVHFCCCFPMDLRPRDGLVVRSVVDVLLL